MHGPDFKRSRINPNLIESLGDQLWTGDSLAILGPRKVGKRYVLRKLRERLLKNGRKRIGRISFVSGGVQEIFGDEYPGGRSWVNPDPDEPFRWVDNEFAAGEGIVTLLASNVDLLPRANLRALLANIRQRVGGNNTPVGRQLAVVLTGEFDLARAVDPDLSGLDWAHSYVISGFDRPTFDEVVRHYLKLVGRFIEPPTEEELKGVYNRTGGSTYFLRLILWSLFDRPASEFDEGREFRRARLGDDSDERVAANIHWNARLRYLHAAVRDDPERWDELERLVRDGALPCANTALHPFELTGIAIRDGNRLVFPGSLCATFLRQYYTDRRFADQYARLGDWPKALNRYRSLDHAKRVRPTDADDVIETADLVKTLRTVLYRKALDNPEGVLDMFVEGCRDLLGFHEVTLWRSDRFEPDWQPQWGGGLNKPKAARSLYLCILNDTKKLPATPARLRLDEMRGQSVIAARLPNPHPDARTVVFVGRPGMPTILSRARARICEDLVDDFLDAYGHALKSWHERELLSIRKTFAGIVNKITAALGGDVFKVRQVLEMAATELMAARRSVGGRSRRGSFKRIIFSLVDPDGGRIEAVVERSWDRTREVSRRTTYDLESDDSGHTWVVNHRQRLVTDASKDDRTCRELVKDIDVRGLAIVPMIAPDGMVVGTISLETADGSVPTEEEADVFEDFGSQLAAILLSTERVEFYRKALDTRTEPIAFFDLFRGLPRLRYANKAAEWVLGHHGWIVPTKSPMFASLRQQPQCGPLAEHFEPLIQRALETRQRQDNTALIRFPPRADSHRERKYHVEACAVPFDDYHTEFERFRDKTAGVICHVRGQDDLYRTLKAINDVVSARSREEVVTSVLEAMQAMGHRRGRLYLNVEEYFVCRQTFGYDPAEAAAFIGTALGLRDDPDNWESWQCITERQPVVFRFVPNGNDRTVNTTREGLPYFVCQSPPCRNAVEKQRGEYWLDFPLLAGTFVVGKVTVNCIPTASTEVRLNSPSTEALWPRDFEFLRIFCELTGVLLKAWSVRDEEVAEKISARVKTANAALHDINTRLVPLGSRLTRYRGLERTFDAKLLRSTNDELESILDEFGRCYEEIIGRSFDEDCRFERVDVGALLQEIKTLSMVSCELRLPDGVVFAEVDRVLFTRIVRELIQNSYDHCGCKPEDLCVTITLELARQESAPTVRMTLADNGRGVPVTNKEKIWDVFSSRSGGSRIHGLGLPMVKRIIERHGGTVSEVGTPSSGAMFVVEIPQYQLGRG